MSQTNTSILSKYPEYGFKSASIYNKRASGRKWLLFLFLFVGAYGTVGMGAFSEYVLYEYIGIDYDMREIFAIIFTTIFAVLALYLNIRWYRKGSLTSSFADYIQPKGKMRFFVKDSKFGLVKKRNFKILVPAMYDQLMWVQDNEVIKAYLNGEEFLIDIYNNRLN